MKQAHLSGTLLAGAIIVLLIISWQGLFGPLVFDDLTSLSPIANESLPDYRKFIFNNHSGPLGRSFSMATFATNHWLRDGFNNFDLKFTNLAIHITNGMLLYCIIVFLLQHTHARNQHRWLALIVASCWLLSPMNSGVVFYAIQRMALLACFFVFAGILFYSFWRHGRFVSPIGKTACLVSCALCWPLACLSKENGVLLPILILIVEFYFFSSGRLFRILRIVLLSLFVGGCVAIYAFHAFDFLNYADRNFTLLERLSTQPLVIAHYIRELLLPASVDIGYSTTIFQFRERRGIRRP